MRDHLDHAFPGLHIVESRAADLCQPLRELVRAANQYRVGFSRRITHLTIRFRDWERDASGLEPQSRRDMSGGDDVVRAAQHQRRVGLVGNQIGVCVAEPARNRERVRKVERLASGARSRCGCAAVARRVSGEFVWIYRRRQRPLVQARTPDRRVRRTRMQDNGRSLGVIERRGFRAATMRCIEIPDNAGHRGRARFPGQHDVNGVDAAAVAVDHDRREGRVSRIDAVRAQKRAHLILNGRQRDAAHVPQPGQPPRHLAGSGERSFIISAGHDDRRRAVGGSCRRDKTLSGFQIGQTDDGAGHLFDQRVVGADDDGNGASRNFRHVVQHDRQRQCARFETESRGQVCGGGRFRHGWMSGHDDPGRDRVGDAVAVRVAHDAVGQTRDRRQTRQSSRRVRAPAREGGCRTAQAKRRRLMRRRADGSCQGASCRELQDACG